jgi:hypothetical protein
MDTNFIKNNNLDLKLNIDQKDDYTRKIQLDFPKEITNLLKFEDEKNFDFYFMKYWNSFVNSNTPKIHFSLEEFLEKMNDKNFIRAAVNKMEFQDRLVSCQYIKIDKDKQGFANFFLMRLPRKNDLCCGGSYYFIYKNRLNNIKKYKKEIFLPKRNTYVDLRIDPDSLDYLANFSIPINEKDRVYCVKCKKLIRKEELFNNKKVISIIQ